MFAGVAPRRKRTQVIANLRGAGTQIVLGTHDRLVTAYGLLLSEVIRGAGICSPKPTVRRIDDMRLLASTEPTR